MNHSEELLRIAGLLRGGMFQPPPAMVEDIIEWAVSKVAAYRLTMSLDDKQMYEDNIHKIENEMNELGGMSLEDADYKRPILESRLERQKRYLEEVEGEIKEHKSKITFPRVQVKSWKRSSRIFKTDLTGWKYVDDIKKRGDLEKGMKELPKIKVTLVRGDIRGKGAAYWHSGKNLMVVSMGVGWKDSVRHEMVHFGQSFFNAAMGSSQLRERTYGLPSKNVQTPEINQHLKTFSKFRKQWSFPGAEKLKKKLKQETGGYIKMDMLEPYLRGLEGQLKSQGVTPDDFHSLDDVEFYANLSSAVGRLNRLLKDNKIDKATNEHVKNFVGSSAFFKALAKASSGKWKKAVKELTKAVMR